MVLTDNEEYFEKLKLFRTHGITKNPEKLEKNDGGWYYEMQELGYNYRLSDIHCALGISQIKKLQKNIDKRREIVKIYDNSLKKYDEIITPFEKKDVKTSYHLYVVNFILEKLKIDRKKIYDMFKANNIGVQVHYIPVHLQPYYVKKFGYKKGDYPISERFYQRALSLPLFPTMTKEDIDDVITVVDEIISKNRR
jgi:dTDP-4-amino-4,6-dideoxygalactose transaminase